MKGGGRGDSKAKETNVLLSKDKFISRPAASYLCQSYLLFLMELSDSLLPSVSSKLQAKCGASRSLGERREFPCDFGNITWTLLKLLPSSPSGSVRREHRNGPSLLRAQFSLRLGFREVYLLLEADIRTAISRFGALR
jgi:hypothetical protein